MSSGVFLKQHRISRISRENVVLIRNLSVNAILFMTLCSGMILNTTHAQLVNEANITLTHWDCGFNEGAGLEPTSGLIDCGPRTGNQVWDLALGPGDLLTDGAGNLRMVTPNCGAPGGSQMRTTEFASWAGIPQSTSEITVFEINFTFEPGGTLHTNDWPFGAFYLHDGHYAGTADLQNHAWWLGNGENPSWSSGSSGGNDASNTLVTGHWIYTKGEESQGVFIEGQHCGVRMILDPNTDGPVGAGTMLIRYEYNLDVLGSGFWTEFTPTDVNANTMRSRSRIPVADFEDIGVWIFNSACDGTAMLVDRARVYEVSSLGETPPNPVEPELWSTFE